MIELQISAGKKLKNKIEEIGERTKNTWIIWKERGFREKDHGKMS